VAKLKLNKYDIKNIKNTLIGQTDKYLIFADRGGYSYIAVVSKEKILDAIKKTKLKPIPQQLDLKEVAEKIGLSPDISSENKERQKTKNEDWKN
jgi:hypothetical protein